MDDIAAIVVAAGRGTRSGTDKVWAPLGDLPVVAYPLLTLTSCSLISETVLVVADERLELARSLVDSLGLKRVVVTAGGPRRRDSVEQGLRLAAGHSWVVVHDGARPFLEERMIAEGVRAAMPTGAAVPVVRPKDTIKQVRDGRVLGTLPREELRLVQTPQVFRTDLLVRALASSQHDVTDEATLLEGLGVEVGVFEGSYENLKITTPEDLDLAYVLLRRRESHG